MNVPADLYEASMNAEGQFKLTVACRGVETKRMIATAESFYLKTPALEFEVRLPLEHEFSYIYSPTSMAQTALGPWKFVRVMDSSSH